MTKPIQFNVYICFQTFQTSVEERHSELVSIKMAAEVLSGLDKRDIEHAVGCYVTAQAPGKFSSIVL